MLIFIAQEHKIRSVPTMIVVDADGKEIRRKVGAMNEEQLLEFLKG